jgi:hypothetical protein
MIINRIEFGTRSYPLSVEVLADEGASVVTYNNSIRVQHGNNLKDV